VELALKYATVGPRYTSYPTAPNFADAVDHDALRARWRGATADLSLYAHIPYCAVRCLFCGCHTVISRKHELGVPYVDRLIEELDVIGGLTDLSRPLRQLALGGGTPNFLLPEDMARLIHAIEARTAFSADAERSIEVDPRTVTPDYVALLKELGFNRFSMGVQDLDPAVMAAVNRDQSESTVAALVAAVRSGTPAPVNLDLIYGLPAQTARSWERTLDGILELRPDRLAVYGYAHVPWMKRHQKRLADIGLPDDALRTQLQARARQRFLDAGYVVVGFDHYALPADELARAQADHTLHRNFMGYTTRRGLDLLALGVSAIADVNGTYTQNLKEVDAWTDAVASRGPAWARGFVLDDEDRVRREVILDLSCNLQTDLSRFAPDAAAHFAAELAALDAMVEDGIVSREGTRLAITELGRPFVRQVCMTFDQYLSDADPNRFSRTS
jgi:oxygen-independent coproporphyrinogen-3 oxidase